MTSSGTGESGGFSAVHLSFRQRLTFCAHLFKAVAKQHHRELVPLLERHISVDAVVVDAGAHAGQLTKLFARIARRGQVHAFEPSSYARAVLERVVRWRALANVEVHAVGLSDAPGEAVLRIPVKPSGSLGFGLSNLGPATHDRPSREETVPLTTLDTFAAERRLHRLDFIKADLEGWEGRLLAGASVALDKYRPTLMLEVVAAHLARAGDEPADLWRLLAPLGYAAYRLPALDPVEAFAGDGDYLFVNRAA